MSLNYLAAGDAENIKVYLRIRPFVEREDNSLLEGSSQASRKVPSIVQVLDQGSHADGQHGTTVRICNARSLGTNPADGEIFAFDAVGGADIYQEDVFASVSKPITENCLQGYNGTIFAYGQTGSGKTYTMQGPVNGEDGSIDYDRRGLIPRTFEYLFERIREEERKSGGTMSYLCKCAYVEIYNECIYDLLVPDGTLCTLREDAKKGVYVEGCREEVIHSPQEAFSIFEQGSRHRHVAETSMNRESSRSHCVFTIFIQSRKLDGEVMDIRDARFNLVDLAGSERQQYSGTAGIRLKEAGNINKSLLALSNVINALVDIANGKPRHVHYRDSRLTFLLRDSLGGNAKTIIIAAVSPSPLCQAETLSTLRFAQRAKQIKNKAVVNKDVQGNVLELQAEVRRLRGEVLLLKAGQFTGVSVDKADLELLAKNTNGDAYFMLQMALERQSELLHELTKKQQQIDLLEEHMRRKEQQLTSERMVAKFRDNTIKALSARLAEQDSSDLLDVFEAERSQYKQEIRELKRQLECHPELTKFAYESMTCKDRLRRYEEYTQGMEQSEATIAKHRKYEELLSDRLVRAERELKLLREGGFLPTATGSDEVPTRHITVSTETLTLHEKPSQEDANARQHDVARLLQEKADLEGRYEDLVLEQELLRRELDDLMKSQVRSAASGESLAHDRSSDEFGGKEQEGADDAKSGRKRRRELHPEEESRLLALQQILTSKIASLEEENRGLQISLEQLRREAEIESQTARDLDQTLLNAKHRLQERDEQLAELNGKLELALESRRRLEVEQEALQQQVVSLREVVKEDERKHQCISTLLEDAKCELAENHGRITTLEGELGALDLKLRGYDPLLEFGSSVEAIIGRLEEGDQNQAMLRQRISKLEFTLQTAQQDNEDLLAQIRELQASADRERLAAAEATIQALSAEMEALQEELLKLRRENDKLIQHTNVKQKLQYHLQIKEENNHFREEIRQLREELTRLSQRNLELEEMLASMNAGSNTSHSHHGHHYHQHQHHGK